MNNVLMYNPSNQHMYEVADTDNDRVSRLEEGGFRRVEKYDLVAIHSPTLNKHLTVLRSDLKTWTSQGYYAEPTWVYHPQELPKIVSSEEAKHLFKNGWVDSPAKFSKSDTEALVEQAVNDLKAEADKPKAKAKAA